MVRRLIDYGKSMNSWWDINRPRMTHARNNLDGYKWKSEIEWKSNRIGEMIRGSSKRENHLSILAIHEWYRALVELPKHLVSQLPISIDICMKMRQQNGRQWLTAGRKSALLFAVKVMNYDIVVISNQEQTNLSCLSLQTINLVADEK